MSSEWPATTGGKKRVVLQGFKAFILRGNVIELATAVVVGAAFSALVAAIGDGLINPVVASLGGAQVNGLAFRLVAGNDASLVAPGLVLTAAVQFLITAGVVYFVFVLPMNRHAEHRRRDEQPVEPTVPQDIELLTEIRDPLRSPRTPPG